jgi:hypothetical protein
VPVSPVLDRPGMVVAGLHSEFPIHFPGAPTTTRPAPILDQHAGEGFGQ